MKLVCMNAMHYSYSSCEQFSLVEMISKGRGARIDLANPSFT